MVTFSHSTNLQCRFYLPTLLRKQPKLTTCLKILTVLIEALLAPDDGGRHPSGPFQLGSSTVSEKPAPPPPVFAQLEYYYSILSGSARNCGNQQRSSCLTGSTWKLEPVNYYLLVNRKKGRT